MLTAKGRVVAAIGYVGKEGHDHLPLGRGDLLICDASLAAVRNGATNPEGLRQFLAAGVDVRSVEGLHAKVVVLPRRAFVGSQNASAHSANHLLEAAIETTDADDVRSLRDFVMGLDAVELTAESIEALAHEFPKRVGRRPVAHSTAAIPIDVDEVVLLGIEFADWSSAETRVYERSRSRARSVGRRRGNGARIEPLALDAWTSARLRTGDWVLQRSATHWYSPGIVIDKSASGDACVIWLSRPRCTNLRLPVSLTPTLHPVNVIKRLTGAEANAAVDLFR